MSTPFLDPKNDFAFKKIFGTEENKDMLIHFLNDILDHKYIGQISQVQFLSTVQAPEIAAKKQRILDVLCTDQKGVQYIIEMQVAKTTGFEKRAQYYAAKAYSRQLLPGEEYDQLKEVIFIAITDFVMFPEKAAVKSDHILLDKKTQAHDLKDFYFTFIELPKFKKELHELSSLTEKWYYYLKHAPETVLETYQSLVKDAPILKRAYDQLARCSWSEAELNTYEQVKKRDRDNAAALHYKLQEAAQRGMKQGEKKGIAIGEKKGMEKGLKQGEKKGLKQGREEGMEKGREEGKIEIAKQMLFQLGLDMDTVQKATGLARAALAQLQAAGK